MRAFSTPRLIAIASVMTLALASEAAWAQEAPAVSPDPGLALDRFNPAPAGDRFLSVQSAYARGHGDVSIMLMTDYASNPLSLFKKAGQENSTAVVSDQMMLRLNGGVALWERLNLNVDIPVAVYQEGLSPESGGEVYTSPSDAEFADIRLGARFRLFGEYEEPFQLGVSGQLWIPTGPDGGFVGTGGVRGMPEIILSGLVVDRLVYSASFGMDFREAQTYGPLDITQESMLRFGAAAGVLLGDERQVQLGPETVIAIDTGDARRKNTNAELLLAGRWRFHDWFEVGAGAGPGLTPGFGTPDIRGVAMFSYSPSTKWSERDRDGDGVSDPKDKCPDVPAPPGFEDGCPPPPDRDGDTIADADDACPDISGVAHDDPAKNGCPSDKDEDGLIDSIDACPLCYAEKDANPEKPGCPAPEVPADQDGDGIPDTADACVDVPGVQDADPAKNGCPGDRDGDGVADPQDACPDTSGVKTNDPATNGCPTAVRVTEEEIVILQKVQFNVGEATILPESDGLIAEVAKAMQDHKEIKSVEVQGHTDNTGPAQLNRTLSQDRAESVVEALVAKGVEKERLTAKGYGPDQPIAGNETEEGQAKNRRVQFKILERTKE